LHPYTLPLARCSVVFSTFSTSLSPHRRRRLISSLLPSRPLRHRSQHLQLALPWNVATLVRRTQRQHDNPCGSTTRTRIARTTYGPSIQWRDITVWTTTRSEPSTAASRTDARTRHPTRASSSVQSRREYTVSPVLRRSAAPAVRPKLFTTWHRAGPEDRARGCDCTGRGCRRCA
jgi:hypothetical protein